MGHPRKRERVEKRGLPGGAHRPLRNHRTEPPVPPSPHTHTHQSGKESALVVERYGGNMMNLHAEPSVVGAGDGPVPPESELSFQTQVMKVWVCGCADVADPSGLASRKVWCRECEPTDRPMNENTRVVFYTPGKSYARGTFFACPGLIPRDEMR